MRCYELCKTNAAKRNIILSPKIVCSNYCILKKLNNHLKKYLTVVLLNTTKGAHKTKIFINMSTRKILATMSFAALFAGAAMAAEPTKTLESIEDVESFDVASGEYVQASGAYYRDGGLPDGKIHKGPVVNVGSMSIDGTFEVKASDQDANRLFDVNNVSGTGEIRFGRGVYISQESNFSNFSGTLTLFTAVNDQGNRKGSGAYFLSGTNNPSYIKAFNLEENTELSFTNGNYTLNGKIEGAGTISARTLGNLNFEGDKILENAAPANVAIKGDISEFSGGYAASGNSTIRLETTLADSVKFSGSQGGSLELVGGAGDAKKTVTVSSGTNTTTSGNVYMYGNKAVIAQNSNDAGTLGANGGTIYFGGKNGYSTAEKVSHTFDTTTVTGNTAGNVVVGGKGTGASMEAGADIVVDGVKIDSLVAGGAEGASVNGDINVTVKSGTVASLSGGKGGIHTGNTNITVENGSVANIYGGDQHGGQIKGDISVNVKDGTVGTIYGANYVSTSEKASDFNGVNGNVKIDVSGGTVNHIRGGINSTNAGDAATAKSKMVLNGNVEVNVSGNAHIGAADGESILATGGSYGSVNGNTTINISDNAVVEGIVAGGASRTDDKGVKSTYINVKGGTLNGDIYGGGLKYSTVTENTNVNISGGTVNANVYGGGATETTIVNGNTNVTLSGNASIKGTLNGGGVNGSVVEGTKTLNIGTSDEAYSNASALKVADFDKINVQGNSVATVNGNMSNVVVRKENTKTETLTGALVNVDSTSTAKFEDSNFNDNSVSVYVENPVQNYAAIVEGGIVNVNNVSEFKNSNFKGNVIKSEAIVAVAGSNVKGGIINASANSTIKIEGSAFEQNTINAKSNSSYATVYGGILNVNDGATANLVTTKFIKNNVSTTDSYGPIYGGIIRSLGDTTITSVTMDGNTLNTSGNASNFYGALISVANGTTTVSDSNFNNTIMEATKDNPMISGAIYVGGEPNVASSAQVLNVSNSTFSGNKATSSYGVNGSALYVTGETATANISNSIFENNTAVAGSYKARGGAVANYNGVMTLTDVSFKGNSAESSTVDPAKGAQGGALYARNYNSGARTVLNDVSFNDNTAKNGMGGAVYVEGSEIEFNVSKNATISGNMASDSDGNMSDSRGGFIYMENYEGSKASSANFNISENVKMTIGDGSLNKDSIASSDNTAVINKSGAGSLVVNGSMADFKGSLIVSAGVMNANNGIGAKSVSIANGATLGVALGNGALENASVANNGTLSLKRGTLADDATFVFSNYSGEGAVKAYGGILSDRTTFTAGKSESFVSSRITVGTGANDVQTVKFGGKLALDFDVAGLGASALTVNAIKESTDLNGIAGNVLAAYDVDLTDNSNDYTVVFSAYVGAIEAADALVAWHKGKDGVWTRLDTSIDYADEIASIVVDGFGSYAFSQVPEPATYAAIFGALALAFAAYRRRK